MVVKKTYFSFSGKAKVSDFFCVCRYSPFLMACFNPETEEFQSVCRVMSGFSDAFYIEVTKNLSGIFLLLHLFTFDDEIYE